ncbi:MAG: hypothetical protein U5K69_08480 [Balneolaceae bacterium]|nr:hypothetical protein [Balneolaceae bacterium]
MRSSGTILKVTVSVLLLFYFTGLEGSQIATGQTLEGPLYTTNANSILEAKSLITLKEALAEIEENYKISFLYNSKLVEGKFVKRSFFKSKNLGQALSKLLVDKGLNYKKETDQIYVLTARTPTTGASDILEVVSGKVTDAETDETLPGVNIAVKGTILAPLLMLTVIMR